MEYFKEILRTRDNQKAEIETIKPRTITLNLSDADCLRLAEKSGGCGLSISELLENFIGDLVDGTYSNGSDERRLATEYFERCWFSWSYDKNLLTHLIEWGDINYFLQDLYELEELKESVAYWVKVATTREDKEQLQDEREALEEKEAEIEEYIEGYFATNPNHKSKEEEIEIVKKWRAEMEALQGVEPEEAALDDKMTEPEEKIYTVYEVANIVGREHHTIREHIKKGILKAAKVGKSWQITETDLKNYLQGRV